MNKRLNQNICNSVSHGKCSIVANRFTCDCSDLHLAGIRTLLRALQTWQCNHIHLIVFNAFGQPELLSQTSCLAPAEILKVEVMYDPFTDFYCDAVSPNGMCLKDFQQKMPRGRHNQAQHHKNLKLIPPEEVQTQATTRKQTPKSLQLLAHTGAAQVRHMQRDFV